MLKQGCLLLSSFILLTACQEDPFPNQSELLHITKVKQTIDKKQKSLNGKQVAKRLVNIATASTPDVNDATVVVAGNYTIVGIDIDKNLDRTKVVNIKSFVAEALKKDPYGANAVVTSDPDIIQRLKNMGKHIRQGSSLSGITRELASIVERLVPYFPNSMRERDKDNNQLPAQHNHAQHQVK